MAIFGKAGATIAAMGWLAATGVSAQDMGFTGPYAGPIVGAVEHHFYVEQTDPRTGQTSGRYYRDVDMGGGAMAGYDLAVTRRMRAGLEVSAQVGGGSPEGFFNGARYQQNARFGYRGAAKLGFVASRKLMVFVKGGYGGDRFGIDNAAGIGGVTEWNNSFLIGTGLQLRLDPGIEFRVEYEHLDGSSHALLIGLPFRF